MDQNTQEKIFEAATIVFYKKGLAGARMQEIADLSGINKAMLHYYYKTKEQLFDTIFSKTTAPYFETVNLVLERQMPLKEKIHYFIDAIMDLLMKQPHLPVFIMHELNRNPARVGDLFAAGRPVPFEAFKKQVAREIKAGSINKIAAEQLFTHLIALTVYPFIAQAILSKVFQMNDKQFHQFLQQRKEELQNNWLNSL